MRSKKWVPIFAIKGLKKQQCMCPSKSTPSSYGFNTTISDQTFTNI